VKYEGKQVVITGTTRGLGKMLATYFQSEGANVVGLSRSEGCDVGTPEDVRRCMPREVGILINNAGVAGSGYAMTLSAEKARDTIATNLLGPLYACQEAARAMRRTGGRIINIGSVHTVLEPVGASAYVASKAGLQGLTGVLSKEFAPFGITVNTLGLSPMDTDMFASLTEGQRAAFIAALPIPRLATFADVVNVVDFFCSEQSGFITGQTVWLGGIHG
jgi:3-oxoacyl-[acyl-carrier protein] reductase